MTAVVRGSTHVRLPARAPEVALRVARRTVTLTNLGKVFWPELGITKRDLLQYYADVAAVLLPHLRDRALVMKRYPNGIYEKFFFMKRTPSPSPEWLETCAIMHRSKGLIAFPMVQDLASLLWLVNLGCIDLNPWYSRCDDIDRPDYLHFDLDPAGGAGFPRVLKTALIVREALVAHGMEPPGEDQRFDRGAHLRRDPPRPVLEGGVALRQAAGLEPRPEASGSHHRGVPGRQATERAGAAEPVRRGEHAGHLGRGGTWFGPEEFTLRNVPGRIRRRGDQWKPLLSARGRFPLGEIL